MTVENTHRTGWGLQLEPKILLHDVSPEPTDPVPAIGDEVELRLPDGTIRPVYIAMI